MLERNNVMSNESKGQRSKRLLKSAVRSVLEMLEERRMFALTPTAVPGSVYNVAEGSSVLVSGLGSTDDGQIVSYQWDTNYSPGRGFRPRFTGPKFNFTASDSGVRTIALRVTDNDGNVDMATTTVNISDVAPTISISGPNNAGEGQSFDISWNHTDPGQSDVVTTWAIDWGDGQITTVAGDITEASHAYAEDGNYQIELTATQADATTSVVHNITISNEVPLVDANTTTPSVDEGDFVNLSFAAPNRVGTIEEWVIDWGDGNIDVLPAKTRGATHQYTDSGNFVATISALEPDGGTGTATVNYTVGNLAPGVAITGAPTSGNEGQAINVGSNVTDAGSDDTHIYGWTVRRDGQLFTLPGNTVLNDTTFSFTPTDNGSYVIRLTVIDDDGGSTTVNSDPIVISNVDPTANISGTPMGNIDEGTLVGLTVNPSDDGAEDTFTYAWSVTKDGAAYTLPNGTDTTSAGFNFIPRDNGSYIATVVVTDDDSGSVQVATTAIVVDNVDPVGAITGEPGGNVNEGSTVSLGSTVTDAGEDDTHTYLWSVEKGGQPFILPGNVATTESTFAFVPTDNGNYVVTLVVTDDDGDTDVITTGTIVVDNVAPTGSIQGPATIGEGASPLFVNDVADAGADDVLTYAWSVEKDNQAFVLPGGTDTSSGSFSFVPTDNGDYVVTLVVTDDDGAQITRTHGITVTNVDPSVQQDNVPATGDEGDPITINSTVSDAGEDDVLTYGWTVRRDGQLFTLPGGTTLDGQSFTFTPTDDGSYVVRLTVIDDDGGSTTVNSDPIVIGNVNPTGVITGEPVGNIDEGDPISLTVAPADAGEEDTFSYAWTVTRDGSAFDLTGITTDQAGLNFIATDDGAYIATVVVTDDNGGTVSVSSTSITVDNVAPAPSINGAPAGADEGDSITVTGSPNDAGANDTHTYQWSVERVGSSQGAEFDGTGGSDTFSPSYLGNTITMSVWINVDGSHNQTQNLFLLSDMMGGPNTKAFVELINGNQLQLRSGGGSTLTPVETLSANGWNHVAVTVDTASGEMELFLNGVSIQTANAGFAPSDPDTFAFSSTDGVDGLIGKADDLALFNTILSDSDIADLYAGTLSTQPVNLWEFEVRNPVSWYVQIPDSIGNNSLSVFNSTAAAGRGAASQSILLPGGTVTTDQSFTFVPTDNGTYRIKLTVTDDDGGVSTVTSGNIVVDNVAPTGVVSGDDQTDEGSTVNYSVAVTDPGSADTHTYSWSVEKDGQPFTLPGGLDVSSSSFAFVPTDNGAYVVSVVVTDDDGGANTYTHNLAVDNVAPTPSITGAPTSENEGTAINLGSSVVDPGSTDTFDYAWSVTKDGAAYGVDGTASGHSFTPDDNGTYVVTLVVTDNNGGTNTTTATITVNNVDPGVIIAGEPVNPIDEGDLVQLTTSVSDAGTIDTHSYAWTVTRDGQAYDPDVALDGATLNFIPRDDGVYVATVVVTDNDGGTVSVNSLDIVVNNTAPTAGITGEPGGNVNEGSTVSLGSTVADAGEDDTHTYLWSVEKDGQPFVLPGNVVTTGNTFDFVPTDNGSYVVTLVVTDDDGASDTVLTNTITVVNAAPAPTISGNASVDEASSITLTASANDPGSADTHTYLWSVEKDGQSYTLPGGVDTTSATFSFTPSRHGTYVVSVIVTDDDGASDTATHNLTVNNLPPVVGITGLPQNARSEGYTFNLNSTAVDPGGDNALTYLWAVTRNGQAFTLPGGTVTNTSTFTFDATDNGLYRVTLAVTDSGGATGTSTTSNITITNANPNAIMDGIPVNSINEGAPLQLTVTADDPGTEDTFTYLWSITKNGQPVTLPVNVAVNGTSFDYTPIDNGTYVVTVTVTDDDNGSTTISSGAITVLNVAPTADITGEPSQSQLEGLLISLSSSIFDPSPNDTHTYLWSVSKDGQPFTLPGNVATNGNGFNFVPTDNGTYVASLTVTDSDGGQVTVTSDPIVIDNAAPTGSISGPASVNEGSSASLSAVVTDAGTADSHTYLWSVIKDGQAYTLPGGTVVDQANFEFTPADNGAYEISVVVEDDDGATVTLTHNLSVENVTPSASILGPASAVEGDQADYAASVLDPGADDTHTYVWLVTKDGEPYGLPLGTDTTSSALSFVPADEGSYEITLVVTDKDGASDSATRTLTVTNANPTASITNAPGAPVSEGSLIQLGSTASDVGIEDELSYAWSVTKDGQGYTLPGELVTDASTFDFTPNDDGSYVVTLVVSDNDSGSVSVSTAAITVTNVAPVAGIAQQPATGSEGSGLSFQGSVTDAGKADTHVYTWTVTKDGQIFALPGGTSSNAIDFSFVPTDNGTYVVTFAVTDKDGDTDSIQSDPVVVTNVAPTGNITGASAANEGSSVGLTANPSDAGSADTFTYAWSVEKDGQAYTLPGGTVTNAASLSFVPVDEGSYVATVVITDDDGDSVTLTKTVTVSNVAPVVELTGVPSSGVEGTSITVGANVSDVGAGDVLTYGWTIRRDGNVVTLDGVVLNQPTLTFTPPDNGSYTVRLTVLDGDGGSTTVTSSAIVVTNVAPAVAITGTPSSSNENVAIPLGSTVTDPGQADVTAGFTYLWTAKRGQTTVATGSNANFNFTPGVHGIYTVTLSVTDKDGGSTTTTATTINVANVAPAGVAINGVPVGMSEAEDALITASASDAPDDSLSFSWEVFRNGSYFGSYQGQSFLFDPHARGQFVIELTATDSYGAETTTSQSLTVSNVAPEATATAPTEALLLGETATFGLSFSDVPPAQGFTVTWDFGDGSSPVVETYTGNQTGLSLNRLYGEAGTYNVTITIDDGVNATVLNKTVVVSRAAVRTDPVDSSKTSLVVLGTTGNDTLLVEPGTAAGKWKVTLNGQVLGTAFGPTAGTHITGGGGNDNITINGGLSATVRIGSGASTVVTGAGNDIIFGSPQSDYLNGGTGRDIVIGGDGKDTLLGGDSEDMVVTDSVSWSNNFGAIKIALDTWNHPSNPFSARVTQMRATGLFSGGNLVADAMQDQVYGEAKPDWLIFNGSIDRVRDYQAGTDVLN